VIGPELDYEWKLRLLLAERGIFNSKPLVALLAEHGIRLSDSQVWRMVTGKPERLNLQVLVALCKILDCTPTTSSSPSSERRGRGSSAARQRGPARPDRSSPSARGSAHHASAVAEPAPSQAAQCRGCGEAAADRGPQPRRSPRCLPDLPQAQRRDVHALRHRASVSLRGDAAPDLPLLRPRAHARVRRLRQPQARGRAPRRRAGLRRLRTLRRARTPALQPLPPRAAAGGMGRWRAAVLARRGHEAANLKLRALRRAENRVARTTVPSLRAGRRA
jgi:DNA-binding Xre family transcriptional regulator